jgi:tetratricopeptide (TPR) repeat protein
MAGLNCPSCGALQPAASPGTECYACGSALSEDDNLPAPVGRPQRPIDLTAPRFGGPDAIDLPAPKQATPRPPPLSSSTPAVADLPAPVRPGNRAPPRMPQHPPPIPPQPPAPPAVALPDDLLAPVDRDAPARGPLPEMPDLLAPVRSPPPSPGSPRAAAPPPDDLLAPRSTQRGLGPPPTPDNLPAPRGKRAGAPPPLVPDLPAPQTRPGIIDPNADNLPAPASYRNLPRPVAPRAVLPPPDSPDLPTPVGPRPSNMPAPKGFFDDGVAPAHDPLDGPSSSLPAPKGFFDDGVVPRTDGGQHGADGPLPAPKGFFDDGVAPTTDEGPRDSGLPAPKGFFDDLADLGGGEGARPLDIGDESFGSAQLDAPIDLGEPLDLGGAGASSRPSLDLEDLDLGGSGNHPSPPPSAPDPGASFDLGSPLEQRPFGLDELDLEDPDHDASGAASQLDTSPFEDVSLPAGPGGTPSAGAPSSDGVVSFTKPSESAVAEGQRALQRRRGRPSDGPLELDTTALPTETEARRTVAPNRAAAVAKKPSRTRTIAGLAVLLILGLGAGGYYAYNEWTSGKSNESTIARNLQAARAQMARNNPGHWMAAADDAAKVLRVEREHVVAQAIRGQAFFASAIDEGVDIDARIAGGKAAVNALRKAAATGPEVDKAEALMAIAEGRPEDGLKRLVAAKNGAPRDPDLHLYSGWAYAVARNWEKAASSFETMLKINPERIAARFGLAEAKLALDKRDEARELYAKVIAEFREKYNRDHVGALVGAAQLAEVEKFSEREERYKEILNRKEYAQADPRAISRVGALAGFEALRAGRVQEARQLFAASMRLDPTNVAAVVGEGEVLVAEGRFDVARERLTQVRSVDPGNQRAALALAAIAVKEEQLTEAKELLKVVFDREPPVTDPTVLARGHRIRARVYALEPGMIGKVEEQYREAMKLSGENNIDASLELARFLVSQEREEDARAVLEPIRERAQSDPSISVTLGVAYLFAGDPVTAEASFRDALAQRGNDVEAKYQLGVALLAQKREDEGLAAIKAAYNTDRTREDIGVALAVAYEERKRFEDALALYESLLKGAEPSLNVKARAGRYFARYGSMDRAVSLGAEIASEQPRHPTALYLLGEKDLREDKVDEAQRKFQEAAERDPQAQYLEAVGRAAEIRKLLDEALAAYARAIEAEADYLAPWLGQARIYRGKRQFTRAIEALDTAVRLAPNNAWAHYARGDSLVELTELSEGVKSLRRAVKLDPKLAVASYTLGRALYNLDKPRPAAAALAQARKHADKDSEWLTDLLWHLGFAHYKSGNRRAAVEAFRAYEERHPDPGAPLHRDARKARIYLEGGGR